MDHPSSKYKRERPTLGVLVGWQAYEGILHTFFEPLFRGIQSAAHDRDCNLLLACGVGRGAGAGSIYPAWPSLSAESDFVPVGPWNTDGLIIATPLISAARSQEIQNFRAAGHPVVFVGAGETGPTVMADNESGVRQALDHLLQHGHRRVAFIAGGPEERTDSDYRLAAYRAAVREFGLETDPRLVAYGWNHQPGGYRAMQQLLNSGCGFTAVLASNDEAAIGALSALKAAHRRVPHEVALVGFDDRIESLSESPSLTTVHYPVFQAGYQALELLLELIDKGSETNPLIKVPVRLVVRQSCGCQPGGFLPPERHVSPAAKQTGNLGRSVNAHQAPSAESRPALDLASAPNPWAEAIGEAVLAEVRYLNPARVRDLCQQLSASFVTSLVEGQAAYFQSVLTDILQQVEAVDDEPHAWQVAISLLEHGLDELRLDGEAALKRPAAMILSQARIAISQSAQRRHSRYVIRQIDVATQLGVLNSRLLTARNEDEIFRALTESLPEIGIHQALVAFFEPEGDDPVAWSRPLQALAGGRLAIPLPRFPSREFPPAELDLSAKPFNLAVLPLIIQEAAGSVSGFVAFDATLLHPHAAIVRQLAAALKNAHLYQRATEGQRLAEEANRLKSRFLSTVSHELRTPLNLIVGLSEMVLREQSQADSPSREDIERIHASARHLDGLIRDVLDLARTEMGQLKLIREPLDLAEVLRGVAVTGEQLARDKGLEWRIQIPDDLPRISGDRTRLGQVVLNLISNAVKFTKEGTIALEVKRIDDFRTIADLGLLIADWKNQQSAISNQQWILASISDTGLGIPPEEQNVIFDEFRQSERTTARGYGGLGLGLAICKRLIELHGGEIGVWSSGEEGHGSTFFFTLPTLNQSASAVGAAKSSTRKQTVLLLADQVGRGDRLRHYLSRQGFLVEEHSVDEANGWLEEFLLDPPGAFILDLQLAAQRGWEILRVLKGHPAGQDIPVLFYSLAQTEDAGSLLELDYLMKPVAQGELAQALARQGLMEDQSLGEKTILIVDDEPEILEMHARLAQAQSPAYRLLKAQNGREALALLGQARVDLVLLDLMMPELDGFGVLEAMRQNETTRTVPVIVLTAQVLTEEDMARLNRGVATVLGKGVFSLEETLGHIETALARNRKLGGEAQRLVRKAMAYVHTHYADPLSRESLARYVGVSKTYLDRCFTQETGLTPMVYLNRYRIHQAKTLLAAGDKRVIEVALSVGFSDIAYFSRVFRREVGVPPSAYRQKRV